jgi:agmatinase
MLKLPFPDGALAGLVAMYSIIHFGPEDRPQALGEFARTLCADGRLLVSFRVDGPGLAPGDVNHLSNVPRSFRRHGGVLSEPGGDNEGLGSPTDFASRRVSIANPLPASSSPADAATSWPVERYGLRMGHEHDHQRDLPPGMAEQLDLAHAGMVSFGHCPFLTEVEQLESWRPDVAIVGAPFDIATTNRPGARFGPRAIRATAYEPGTYHLDLGLEIFDWLEVVDFGDAYCPHGQTEVSHTNIRDRVHAVASRGIVPVILGGDHSITWPAATAVADVHGYGNVGIVHFDAHADTADEIEGNLASHGTPMRRLIESGAVPGTHFVQVGLRGYWPPQDTFEWMLEQGMTWHTMQEIWDRGFKDVMRDAVSEALAKADKLYVSVDIDVLDPAHAPGTGTPEPGGITSADLLRLVRQLCYEHDVAGVDVVEVAPAYDHAELTVNAAHRVVFEALAGMAARRRDAAQAKPGPPAR